MGTHLRELGRSYPMNTNMSGFRWFSKIFINKFSTFVSGLLSRFDGSLASFTRHLESRNELFVKFSGHMCGVDDQDVILW